MRDFLSGPFHIGSKFFARRELDFRAPVIDSLVINEGEGWGSGLTSRFWSFVVPVFPRSNSTSSVCAQRAKDFAICEQDFRTAVRDIESSPAQEGGWG